MDGFEHKHMVPVVLNQALPEDAYPSQFMKAALEASNYVSGDIKVSVIDDIRKCS